MKKIAKLQAFVLSAVMALSTLSTVGFTKVSAAGFEGQLTSVDSARAESNVVKLSFNGGAVEGKITFLENGIFRYNVDPAGKFEQYAVVRPSNPNYTAKIQAQPDDSDKYSKPAAKIKETDAAFEISVENGATIVLDKATAKMSIKNKSGEVVMSEKEALTIGSNQTNQVLNTNETEYFFGGGTQNGRFTHKGKTINIANESGWTDGQVASPNPFYWSNAGYGVMRNTFYPGSYDFASNDSSTVNTTHNENEFDAYYFVSDDDNVADTANTLLNDYYAVTGNPVLLPEYAFYLSHLNCYNRDAWEPGSKWQLEDGQRYNELSTGAGYVIPAGKYAESLNNTPPTVLADGFEGALNNQSYKFSASAVIDGHVANDMPLGWFLPNDGYGCGYGQNGYYLKRTASEIANGDTIRMDQAINANIENLKDFTEYAESKGVHSGLWTQAALTPATSEIDRGYQGFHTLRDFQKEVSTGGVSALKTDVAWVGAGYAMGLNSVKDGYTILASANKRPTVVSLDGWAGTQRYASIWSGDQYGGQWEYIRFHIPTYIGQSLSGNPNIGSDMDGIFGGTPLIYTRDTQWKVFTQTMLDMDGWGAIPKKPYLKGDPYTAINRMYLKLKAQLMPYLYTEAHRAVDGLPMIRAMFLEEANEFTYSTATQYQYMYGDNFLVAPIYQNTQADEIGNDIRNDIYLPSTADSWIDYFTGKHYRGGQIINNFDAPIWKLPLFVKNGSIIPMYEENNNPMAVTTSNEKGLDKTRRIVEFYPHKESSYELIEDDGISLNLENNVPNYGTNVKTTFTSKVEGTTATLTANKSQGTYKGYNSNRHSTFVVNVSKKPTSVTAKNGSSNINATEATSLADFEAKAARNEAAWFYDESPNLNKYSKEDEAFKDTAITTTPKLYVSFTKANVNEVAQTLVVEGFENDPKLDADQASDLGVPTNIVAAEETKTPTSITLTWDAVEGATSYEVKADGIIRNAGANTTLTHSGLKYNSQHTYQVRARNAQGYSAWSDEFKTSSLDDPFRNVPKPQSISWSGKIYGSHTADLAFNQKFESGDGGFHSNNGGINESLIVDYGYGYNLDKLEYYPRDDAGNGTVTRMEISTSLDGVHWTEPKTYDWASNAEMKSVELDVKARYVRMIPRASVGTFFSASEIMIYRVDNSKPFEVGSIATHGRTEVTDADYTNLTNYKGLCNLNKTFTDQVENYGLDINMNGIYDVYDYAFTMFKLDGGTKAMDSVTGKALLLANKSSVKAGETFTVDLYASNVKNLNAIGSIIDYDASKVEFKSIQKGVGILSMEDLSQNTVVAASDDVEARAYYDLAFANRGNVKPYSGTGVLASMTFTAKEDIDTTNTDVIDLTNVMLIGPNYSLITTDASATPQFPEINTVHQYVRNDFDITMTNEHLTSDAEGTNNVTLCQNGYHTYEKLFNGDTNTNDFEFKWDVTSNHVDGKLPDAVTLPITMTFTMKNPRPISKVKYYNRPSGNGSVTSIEAQATYTDGTKSEKISLTSDDMQTGSIYNFLFDSSKNVQSIAITPLTSNGNAGTSETTEPKTNRMLTIREIEFIHEQNIPVESIVAAQSNAKEIYVGEVTDVKASVTPSDASDPYFTVTSDNPAVANVITIAGANNVPEYLIRGNAAGEANITITSHGNTEKSATYKVTVLDGVNTAELDAAIEKATNYSNKVYTEDSLANLTKALQAGKDLLATEDYTAMDVALAALAINDAIDALVYKPLNEYGLINTSAETDVTTIEASSECKNGEDGTPGEPGFKEATLDYDPQTHWHSDYINNPKMPQYILYDLGKEYNLTAVQFLPRVNGYNGDIYKVEILAGTSQDNLTSVGIFTYKYEGKQLVDREKFKRASFEPINARYVKFNVLGAIGDNKDRYASAAEVRFYETVEFDKTALQARYDEVKDTKESSYTADSWDVFAKALEAAKAELANDLTCQKNLDDALATLNETFAKLVKKPATVQNVKTSKNTYSSVKLTWDKVEGATGYEIARSTTYDGKYSTKTVVKDVDSAIINKLKTGQKYFFKVRAIRKDEAGNVYGNYSSRKSATPIMDKAPVISSVKQKTYGTLEVNWKGVAGAQNYYLERRKAGTSTWKHIKTFKSADRRAESRSLDTGTKYEYRVRAGRYSGEVKSPYSNVKGNTPVMKTTTVTVTKKTSTSAKVSWKTVSGASGYEVYRATSSTGKYSKLKSVNADTKSLVAKSLSKGKTYYFKVRAYRNVNGKKVYNNFSKVVSYKVK